MKPIMYVLALAALAAIAGCASSSREEQSSAIPAPSPVLLDTLTDLSAVVPEQPEEEVSEIALMEHAEEWTPRYVPTGLACGIMVEFTGLKKGKTLQARYANIELRRYLVDSASQVSPGTIPPLSGLMRTQTTINSLHQAFFKVQPGIYFFRLSNPWADRRMIRGLEVRDGSYSVLSNDVYAAWLRRTRQSPDTSSVKP